MKIEMQEPSRGRGMKIDPKNITVRELVEGFSGKAEEGARFADSPSLGRIESEGRRKKREP
ncbi:MAG: hypothetical protein KJZ62_05430 [Fimbriimonadaceae bacterium]|nr:hypothetical protein [Fimbriimonadaceae bacterium]MCL4284524.1 hypothetical protein [Fimbriimonadaceae bacterium]